MPTQVGIHAIFVHYRRHGWPAFPGHDGSGVRAERSIFMRVGIIPQGSLIDQNRHDMAAYSAGPNALQTERDVKPAGGVDGNGTDEQVPIIVQIVPDDTQRGRADLDDEKRG